MRTPSDDLEVDIEFHPDKVKGERCEERYVLSLSTKTAVVRCERDGVEREVPTSQLAELERLLAQQVVNRAEATQDGSLTLEFSGGLRVSVAPAEDFEAWELTSHKGIVALASAGGGLATWS